MQICLTWDAEMRFSSLAKERIPFWSAPHTWCLGTTCHSPDLHSTLNSGIKILMNNCGQKWCIFYSLLMHRDDSPLFNSFTTIFPAMWHFTKTQKKTTWISPLLHLHHAQWISTTILTLIVLGSDGNLLTSTMSTYANKKPIYFSPNLL